MQFSSLGLHRSCFGYGDQAGKTILPRPAPAPCLPGLTCPTLEMGRILSWAFSRQCSRAAMKVNCCCWKSLYFCSMLRRLSFTSFIVALGSHGQQGSVGSKKRGLEVPEVRTSIRLWREVPSQRNVSLLCGKEPGPGRHMFVLGPSSCPP